jgi:hypothetical protein
VAPRLTTDRVGGSEYGRIVILATSRAPVVSASAPAPFRAPRPIPQPLMPQVDDTEPENVEPAPGSQPFPGPTNQPGMQPGQPMPEGQQQGPITAPRPGPLPQRPTGPGNPYQPQPGVRPPGTPGAPPRPGGPGGGGFLVP